MNLPNKLTLIRVVLIIPFVILLLCGFGKWSDYAALGIFIAASLTDMLDGYIARSRNLVTTLGKFMDPLADKLLVCSALICLLALSRVGAVPVIIIMAREFIISGFRLVASERGTVIAASWWGKTKTVSQMLAVGLMLADIPVLRIFTQVITWIAVALTVISLIDYMWKNRAVMR